LFHFKRPPILLYFSFVSQFQRLARLGQNAEIIPKSDSSVFYEMQYVITSVRHITCIVAFRSSNGSNGRKLYEWAKNDTLFAVQ